MNKEDIKQKDYISRSKLIIKKILIKHTIYRQ